MKKIFIILMAAVIAAISVGCTTAAGDALPSKVPLDELGVTLHPVVPGEADIDNPLADDGVDILNRPNFVETFRLGGSGDRTGAVYRLVTTPEEFTALVGSASSGLKNVTADSFTYNFAVAVLLTVNTGGYTIEVEHAENDGRTVTVSIILTPPSGDQQVTQAFETHCVLVGFDSSEFFDDLVYDITVNGEAAALGGEAI